jgi:hypothetical protein
MTLLTTRGRGPLTDDDELRRWGTERGGQRWRIDGWEIGLRLLGLTDDPRAGLAMHVAFSYAFTKATDDDLARAHRSAIEAMGAAPRGTWANIPAQAAFWCTRPAPEWRDHRRPDYLLARYSLILRPEQRADVVHALDQLAGEDQRFRRLADKIGGRDPMSWPTCCSCGGRVEPDTSKRRGYGWDTCGIHMDAKCTSCGLGLWYYSDGRTTPRQG